MNIQNECRECLIRQIDRFLEGNNKNDILNKVKTQVSNANANNTPPMVAIDTYNILSDALGNKDPYKHIKINSMEIAKNIAATLNVNTLEEALKACVIGNAIDYGSQLNIDIKEAIRATMQEDFAINDFISFKKTLDKAKNMLFIADNAGENYFDEILIRFIKNHYDVNITYLVRGKPIINDVTMDDLLEHKSLFELCNVQSSGVPSPGFIYGLANNQSKDLFNNSCIILAKGMGNFECLESTKNKKLFLLFKIKCSVVSQFIGHDIGKLVFINNK